MTPLACVCGATTATRLQRSEQIAALRQMANCRHSMGTLARESHTDDRNSIINLTLTLDPVNE